MPKDGPISTVSNLYKGEPMATMGDWFSQDECTFQSWINANFRYKRVWDSYIYIRRVKSTTIYSKMVLIFWFIYTHYTDIWNSLYLKCTYPRHPPHPPAFSQFLIKSVIKNLNVIIG